MKLECDFCKKQTVNLETIILYNNAINYCEECSKKAFDLNREYKQELLYQNVMFDIYMKNKEKELIKKYIAKSTKI
jgi:hypothetical protein